MGSTTSLKVLKTFILIFICYLPSESNSLAVHPIILGICCNKTSQLENGTCESTTNISEEWLKKSFVNLVALNKRHVFLSKEYNFQTHELSCGNESYKLTLDAWNSTEDIIVDGKSLKFMPSSGYLQYGNDNFKPMRDFCIHVFNTMEIQICRPKYDSHLTKCCDMDQVWDLSLYPDDGPIRCRPSGNKTWNPTFYEDVHSRFKTKLQVEPHLLTNHPRNWCKDSNPIMYSLRKGTKFQKRDLFKILPNGEIWQKIGRKMWQQFPLGTYCIDGAMNFDGDSSTNAADEFSGNELDTVVFSCGDQLQCPTVCYPPEAEPSISYGVSLGVASCFLFLTVAVYIALWERQNVHGWTSMAYFASLFAMYVFSALQKFDYLIFSQEDGQVPPTLCYIIAICTHFFWLSSFCWMSAVNFDLWWTFRSLMPTGSKSKGVKRFLYYVIFAVGVPLSIVCLAMTLDAIYRDDLESDVIIPEYGKLRCSLDRENAYLAYLYIPISILLLMNLLFFTATVYDMYKIQQSTKFASMNSSVKNSRHKQSVKLFLKLLILMGIPWGFEVLSYLLTPCQSQSPWYWAVFDYINIFQGVAIFLTFVCKSETRNSLEMKYPRFKQLMNKLTIQPDRAQEIVDRHPKLKVLVRLFTRNGKGLGGQSRKTISTSATGELSRQSGNSYHYHLKLKRNSLGKMPVEL